MRNKPFAHKVENPVLKVYGNKKVEKRYNEVIKKGNDTVRFNYIEPGKTYKIGKMKVCPVLADHGDEDENCLNYIINIKDKYLLYGHDSGIFPEESFEIIKDFDLDGVILDCTGGPQEIYKNHMGIKANIQIKERLMEIKAADENTKFILTHFSHNGGLLHNELIDLTRKYDFIITYDGMKIEI